MLASRRTLLLLPVLAAPAALAAPPVPPFQEWIGRTALLAGEGGAARLLLAADGTGMMAVRLLLFCRALPVRRWSIAEDGMAVRYARVSALDPARVIEGEAQIVPGGREVAWVEAARHVAQFQGFADAEAAGRCS